MYIKRQKIKNKQFTENNKENLIYNKIILILKEQIGCCEEI